MLALIIIGAEPPCGAHEQAPEWVDVVLAVQHFCALVTVASAVVALLLRHWFIALVGLVTAPVLTFMAALSTCAVD